MPIVRALLYARVSTEQQKRKVHTNTDEPSISQQFEKMQEAAHRRGWQIVGRIEDVISGSVPISARPGGSVIYSNASSDAFDVLMVYMNDRIGRDEDGVVAKVFRADMRFMRKQIFSVHEPMEPKAPDEYQPYEDDSALWLESVSDTASSVYIRQFRRRHAFGMRKRVETKRLMAGTPPIGYVADRHILPNGRTVLGERRPDPIYAPIVKRIFDEYEAGHSFMSIAGLLNKEGLRTPRGLLWTSTTIKGMINNPTYYGATVYYKDRSIGKPDPKHPRRRRRQHQPMDKWLIVEDAPHPPLITKAQWLHCQAIKRGRGSFGRTYGESTLLSGLMECGKCGSSMHRNGGWGLGYFSCNRYWKTGKTQCSPNSIKRYDVETGVVDYLGQLARSPEIVRQLEIVQVEQDVADVTSRMETITTELSGVATRLAKAREAYEAGVDSVAEYAERKKGLAERQIQLEEALSQARTQLEASRRLHHVRHSLVEVLRLFPERFRDRPLRFQKLLLREIIERVVVVDREFTIRFKKAGFTSSTDYDRTLSIVRAFSDDIGEHDPRLADCG